MLLLERALALIAPHNCLGCNTEGWLLCPWCRADACPAMPSRCYRCKAATQQSAVCLRCRPRSRLGHVWVCAEYDGLPKRLVRKLKYGRARAAALEIAAVMHDALPYFDPETIITHVPTATSRVRQRGYDHAQLIARAFAAKRGLRYVPLLMRQGQTRQVGAKKADRMRQLQGAYMVLGSPAATRVLLIDDVVTTGSTVEAAAAALKSAGVKKVDAALFAQKI